MDKIKILVVDDDPKLSRLVRLILEKTHMYEVCEVNQSVQALNVARTFQPQAVLLDVDMPGKDGGQVAREMAADPGLGGVPVLFLTSLVSLSEAGEQEVIRGDKRFLAKPVSPRALIGALDRLLKPDSGVVGIF